MSDRKYFGNGPQFTTARDEILARVITIHRDIERETNRRLKAESEIDEANEAIREYRAVIDGYRAMVPDLDAAIAAAHAAAHQEE